MIRWDLLSDNKYNQLLSELKAKLDNVSTNIMDVEQLYNKADLLNQIEAAEHKSSNTDKWVVCDICHKLFQVKYNTFKHSSSRKGVPWRCPTCLTTIRSERATRMNSNESFREKQIAGIKSWYNSMTDDELRAQVKKTQDKLANKSPEEKRAIYERVKQSWKNKSDKEMQEIRKRMSKNRKEFWNSITDEERAVFVSKISDIWDRMNSEEKMRRCKKISDSRKKYYESLSDEEMEEIKNRSRNIWNNLSDEKKEHVRLKNIRWWNDRSDAEKHAWVNKQVDRWNNLSNEEKEEFSIRSRNIWKNLSTEEKMNRIRMVLSSASRELNSTNIRFIKYFNNSSISTEYYFNRELQTVNNGVNHSWDYGIFSKSDNALVMVIDIDGAYFHADSCDYDGIHSKEEYDEKRSLSIPDRIKWFIIHEFNFSQDFKTMIKMLMIDYDEFIGSIFKECKHSPFPYPDYDSTSLLKSYEKLRRMNCNDKYHNNISLNTRLGDRLIQHFHHSIWHAHVNGKPSPYDAWKNDNLLRKCIENRVIYQNHLNPNKILQGFNVSKIAPKVSVFSAGRAKLIIHKYLSEYDTIFDPFSGFGGRMLGTISLDKKYIGQDISYDHVCESNKMIKFLTEHQIQLDAEISCKNILNSSGEYPCLFTCPPYGDKEIWHDVKPDTRTCDDWIDICLKRFKCHRYVFIVDTTEKYKDHIVDHIINKNHFSENAENMILIDREG